MTPDEMKALIAEARGGFPTADEVERYSSDALSLIERLTDALEAAYDAGRRELAERFATQDTTREAAIEELIAWEDEIEAHVTSGIVSDADGAELAVSSIPTLIAEVRRLRALSAHPDEETEWEIKWAPVLRDGAEWAIRDEAECDALIAEYADPAHWIYEDYNDDLEPVVGKRAYRRRKAGPWLPVPEGSET